MTISDNFALAVRPISCMVSHQESSKEYRVASIQGRGQSYLGSYVTSSAGDYCGTSMKEAEILAWMLERMPDFLDRLKESPLALERLALARRLELLRTAPALFQEKTLAFADTLKEIGETVANIFDAAAAPSRFIRACPKRNATWWRANVLVPLPDYPDGAGTPVEMKISLFPHPVKPGAWTLRLQSLVTPSSLAQRHALLETVKQALASKDIVIEDGLSCTSLELGE